MAAQRYEISLRVHEKRNFVSAGHHVIIFLLYKIHKCLSTRENTAS